MVIHTPVLMHINSQQENEVTLDISSMVLFLCSSKASFINGENICIDGGMTKQMIYHEDGGWHLD